MLGQQEREVVIATERDTGLAPPILRIDEVVKRYGEVTALRGVSLDIPDGAFFSLLGPSGCGKTTLLMILGGLETPDEGDVVLDGASIAKVAPERRPFNLVFQSYALFPHLTVEQNVGFGPRYAVGRPRAARSQLTRDIASMLDLVGLSGYQRRMPSELSGGQAQRVALARALINRPRLLLLDEPMAALDRNVRMSVREQLVRIHAELGTTFVLVTHDQEEALSMSTHVALMDHGVMKQVSDPETLYTRPGSLFAARFVGAGSLLPVTVGERRGDRICAAVGDEELLPLIGDAVPGRPAMLLLRPQELRLTSVEDGRIVGAVLATTYLGQTHEVVVATELGEVRAHAESAPAIDERVGLTWDPARGVAVADDV